ncbi:MAG: DoxX family protein [Patiriisocius sp.]|uniref:DoxX family protein n=1 Tax=Patiriisocius sp. TaxID=2822396 RepID=UPI003EF74720
MTSSISEKPNFNLAQRIFFRFFFVYFVLYIIPFPASYIPGVSQIVPFVMEIFTNISLWFGEHVFGISDEIDPTPGGSGDRLFNYVQMFTYLIIAVVATVIWSIVDFKRKNYHKLLTIFTVFLRYYLASILLSYGFSKVFLNQFSELSLGDLVTPYGDSSPMGLIWNFMEYSDAYTIFSGLAEVVGGLLLLFRRTTTLGALVSAGVMLNVFMMNMSFDVPVKLFSGHLLLISVFLLLLDSKRVIYFFILNKPTEKKQITNYFSLRKWNISQLVLKIIFILYIVIFSGYSSYQGQFQWGKKAPKPALFGIYTLENFIVNQDTLSQMSADSIQWKRFIVDKYSTQIQFKNDENSYWKKEIDTIEKTLKLSSWNDSTNLYDFKYKFQDSILKLDGMYRNDTLYIELKLKDINDYLLINRKFNWVNEYPFNR